MVNKESHRARKKFRNFEDARKFAREIGLKSAREWSDFARSGTMPIDIPERPEQFYTKSWDGWADWLGNDESKAWEIMEKLRKTTGDFSNYKKALAEYDWANTRLADKAPKTKFDPKSGSVKNMPSRERELLTKRIQSSIAKLEKISEKLTNEPGLSPKNPIPARKKLTSKEFEKIHNKIDQLSDAQDWAGIYAITKDVVTKPSRQIEQRTFDEDETMVNSHHIDALIELKRPKEALEFGKRLLRATRDDDGLVAIAWFCLGQIYYELERYDESISAYKSCLTAACGEDLSINAWYNLASSNAKAGNIDQACNSLIACLATTDEPDAVLLDIPDDEDFKSLDGHPLFEKIISVSDVRDLF